MSREVIVVDVESTGLGSDADILEVAAVSLSTGVELSFVPCVSMETFAKADPKALEVNRYFERGVRSRMLDAEETGRGYHMLREWLEGNVLAGSNPAFDAELLSRASYAKTYSYASADDTVVYPPFGRPWHHRLLDLSAYAAGVLGIPVEELPGLHKVCELLGVVNEEAHSALGDARATAECFRILQALAKQNRAR
ncbi:DnaQ-like DNA polymerase III subunit [Mycobacterium phage Superphikiman]|uniref:DnaQ-like DNA polymerase III subunit n=2 Tax=Omegavirus TaxID=1623292 RepID=A0A2D2W479_9CAUD|nr:DnaQ-like DNA polymerase III subunit [Mycobacterium phage Superphikiman]